MLLILSWRTFLAGGTAADNQAALGSSVFLTLGISQSVGANVYEGSRRADFGRSFLTCQKMQIPVRFKAVLAITFAE